MSEQAPRFRAHGRRPRQTTDTVRAELLKVGLQHAILPGGGVRASLNLYMEHVVADADVSRSAAYRVFPEKDDFTDALLSTMIRHADSPGSRMFSEADTIHAVKQATLTRSNSADIGEAFRNVVGTTMHDNVNRPQNTLRPGLAAAIDAIHDDALRTSLATEHEQTIDDSSRRAGDYFVSVGSALNFEMRPGLEPYGIGSASIVYLGGLALTPHQLRESPSFTSLVEVGASAFIDSYMQST